MYQPSEKLAAVVGGKPKSRGKVVKRLWAYIKDHKLQDKKSKRTINPDKKLAKVIGDNPIDMFKMQKKLYETFGACGGLKCAVQAWKLVLL